MFAQDSRNEPKSTDRLLFISRQEIEMDSRKDVESQQPTRMPTDSHGCPKEPIMLAHEPLIDRTISTEYKLKVFQLEDGIF
jgi:hypothetical protein